MTKLSVELDSVQVIEVKTFGVSKNGEYVAPETSDETQVSEGGYLVTSVALNRASDVPFTVKLDLVGSDIPVVGDATVTSRSTFDQNDIDVVSFTEGVTYNPETNEVTIPAGVSHFEMVTHVVVDGNAEGVSVSAEGESYTLAAETGKFVLGNVEGNAFSVYDALDDVLEPVKVTNVSTFGLSQEGEYLEQEVSEGNYLVTSVSLNRASDEPVALKLDLANVDLPIYHGTAVGLGNTVFDKNDVDLDNMTFTNGVTYNAETGEIIVPAGVSDFNMVTTVLADNTAEGVNFNVDDSDYRVAMEHGQFVIGGVASNEFAIYDAVNEADLAYSALEEDNAAETIADAVAVDPVQVASVTTYGLTQDVESSGAEVSEGNYLLTSVSLNRASEEPVTFKLDVVGKNVNVSGSAEATGSTTLDKNDVDLANSTFTNGVTYNAETGEVTVPAGVVDFDMLTTVVDDQAEEGVSFNSEEGDYRVAMEQGQFVIGGVASNEFAVYDAVNEADLAYALELDGENADAEENAEETIAQTIAELEALQALETLENVVADVDSFLDGNENSEESIEQTLAELDAVQALETLQGIVEEMAEPVQVASVTTYGLTQDVESSGAEVSEGNYLLTSVSLNRASEEPVTFKLDVVGKNVNVSGSAEATGSTTLDKNDVDLANSTFTNGVTYNAETGEVTVPAGVVDFDMLTTVVDDQAEEGVSFNAEEGDYRVAMEQGQFVIGGVASNEFAVYDAVNEADLAYALELDGENVDAEENAEETIDQTLAELETLQVLEDVNAYFEPVQVANVTTYGLTQDVESAGAEVSEGNYLFTSVSLNRASDEPLALKLDVVGVNTDVLGNATGTASTAFDKNDVDLENTTFTNGVTYNAATSELFVPQGVKHFNMVTTVLEDNIEEGVSFNAEEGDYLVSMEKGQFVIGGVESNIFAVYDSVASYDALGYVAEQAII